MTKIITLTSDFGLKDPYVAEMKAVILGILPNCSIVDISHLVEKYSVREGAFLLASAVPYFPEGTIHIAVVDPGVGTRRRPIVIETTQGYLVGPDNGVLVLAAESLGIKNVHEITSRQFMLSQVSETFHGRDVFAPAAAHLAKGLDIEELGRRVTEFVRPRFTIVDQGRDALVGEVLHIDHFGNIITNLLSKEVARFKDGMVRVELPGTALELSLSQTYADVKPQEPLALIGGHNCLEIALNQGSAAKKFSTKTGDRVTISRV